MDFNNDIGGGHMFDDIHTISASWREYLGNAYENPDAAAGEEVQNITANRPRAKTGDPVKLVTNDEGDIWIGDLNGHNRDSILQMVRGYLTAHYQACGKWLAKVPFKKLGKYQADMISSRHLPPNFMFNVDPSHMHISLAMELLNFWKECQEIYRCPEMEACSLSRLPENAITKSRQSPTSADDSTDTDDYNINTEEEATNNMTIAKISSRGKSSDARHRRKNTPMPFMCPTQLHTDDEDQHELMSTEDERAGNEALPVVMHPSTSKQSTIPLKGSRVTAELQDTSDYMDDDEFDSVPFADVRTMQSGLSRQHGQGGKLKSAMKNHVGRKQTHMEGQSKLKTTSHPQQSTVKPTKRCRETNDHSSAPGPST
ncbi:hypothetical protein EV401DRAFT_2081762 [Pisolithus croceorrhizus]|nr:hypothetical protein EV401DRAFT_2081762 [Pisolithus croceorrhizus]